MPSGNPAFEAFEAFGFFEARNINVKTANLLFSLALGQSGPMSL
jgi:hypothetical protein